MNGRSESVSMIRSRIFCALPRLLAVYHLANGAPRARPRRPPPRDIFPPGHRFLAHRRTYSGSRRRARAVSARHSGPRTPALLVETGVEKPSSSRRAADVAVRRERRGARRSHFHCSRCRPLKVERGTPSRRAARSTPRARPLASAAAVRDTALSVRFRESRYCVSRQDRAACLLRPSPRGATRTLGRGLRSGANTFSRLDLHSLRPHTDCAPRGPG